MTRQSSKTQLLSCAALLTLASACGGNSSPSAPTPTPTPTPTTYNLSGQVTSTTPSVVVKGATITIADGPNANKTTTTDASGNYAFTGLTPSGFSANVAAAGYGGSAFSVTLTSTQTKNVQLSPLPLFNASGVGNSVFDVPTYVSRIRVRGTYTGYVSNFIIYIGGHLVVNDIVGTSPIAVGTTSDGTYLTTGGTGQVQDSAGVAWSIAELAGVR